ncbi:hypothetical protein F5X99DRAFT_132927 [Biscogniauxia marginata]|nr:hypothetical protein F5X99DRAFT_132927 [Biscogniauxia marginata]
MRAAERRCCKATAFSISLKLVRGEFILAVLRQKKRCCHDISPITCICAIYPSVHLWFAASPVEGWSFCALEISAAPKNIYIDDILFILYIYIYATSWIRLGEKEV